MLPYNGSRPMDHIAHDNSMSAMQIQKSLCTLGVDFIYTSRTEKAGEVFILLELESVNCNIMTCTCGMWFYSSNTTNLQKITQSSFKYNAFQFTHSATSHQVLKNKVIHARENQLSARFHFASKELDLAHTWHISCFVQHTTGLSSVNSFLKCILWLLIYCFCSAFYDVSSSMVPV